MEKPDFAPLLNKLKEIIYKSYTAGDIKQVIPSDLNEVFHIAKALSLPPLLKREAAEIGLAQLKIIIDDVDEFNAKNHYLDKDSNDALIDWTKKDAEKAYGYYHVLNIHWRDLDEVKNDE